MAVVCSCDVIDTQAIKTYLAANGPVRDDKSAKIARANLHKQAREQRVKDGLDDKMLCARCVIRLMAEISKESRAMYPEAHAEAA